MGTQGGQLAREAVDLFLLSPSTAAVHWESLEAYDCFLFFLQLHVQLGGRQGAWVSDGEVRRLVRR